MRARLVFGVFGLLAIGYGFFTFDRSPALGVAWIVFGLWYFEHCALPSSARRRLVKHFRRDPFATEDATYVIDRSGLHKTSATMTTSISWKRFQEVRPFQGGLLLVGTAARSMQDLPPTAFPDLATKEQAAISIRRWLVDEELAGDEPVDR